jgi:predicted PurR-regulated permease PerM
MRASSDRRGASSAGTVPGEWPARRVFHATLVVLAFACGAALLYRSATAFVGLFVAIVISASIRPAVDFLFRRGVPRWTGALAVHFALLGIIFAFLLLVLPLLLEQSAAMVALLPGFYATSRQALLQSTTGALSRLVAHLPAALPNAVPSAAGRPLDALSRISSITGLGRSAFLAASVVALGFYWTVDGEQALSKLLRLLPAGRRERFRDFLVAAQDKMGRYVWGQAIICAVVGVLSGGAYAAIGLPHALVLGLLAGALDAIPLLGPVLGMLPAALIALAIRPSLALWVVLIYLVIHAIENYLLAPRVMGKTVGVNPLVTLLSITAFGSLLGLTGVFLAIPIAAVLQLILEGFIRTQAARPPGEVVPHEGLRLEAHELMADLRRLVHHDAGGIHEDPHELESAVESIAADLDRILEETVAALEMP